MDGCARSGKRLVRVHHPEHVGDLGDSISTTMPTTPAAGPSFLNIAARASLLNALSIGATASGGFILAAILSAESRGGYAAVQTWLWLSLVLGEFGLPAALVYFVAREPTSRVAWTRSSRLLVAVSGAVVALAGVAATDALSRGDDDLATAYRLMFIFVPFALYFGMNTFVLQATSISTWLRVRAVQPLTYVLGILILWMTDTATLLSALAVLIGSTFLQALAAYRQVRRLPADESADPDLRKRRLVRFGFASLLGGAPALITVRVDQAVLSTTVDLADLGQYAVAVSISTLILPIVAGLGHVAFPRLASQSTNDAERWSVIRSVLIIGPVASCVGALIIFPATLWAIPRFLGSDYGSVPDLVALLLPGSIGLAAGNVLGDVLRGLGRPRAVGTAQLVGAVMTVAGLWYAVPRWGVFGAAVVSSLTYCITWLVLAWIVLRSGRRPS